jgi:hypothetical protein
LELSDHSGATVPALNRLPLLTTMLLMIVGKSRPVKKQTALV